MSSSTIPLSEIPTLTLLYKLGKLTQTSQPNPEANSKWNNKISLVQVDITKLGVDAVVNAANESLLGGGGVDGAIHRAAGKELLEECRTLDGCKTGSAKITNAYGNLPCRKVIHAVGPVYRRRGLSEEDGGDGSNERLLRGCYTTSLDLAAQYNLKSIAFSALSTGVYGYPSAEAANVAVEAVKEWLEADQERASKIERVVFCQFMNKDQQAYEDIVPEYFSPDAAPAKSADEAQTQASEAAEKYQAHADVAADVADTAEALDSAEAKSEVPDLPDVPTKEPKQPDEPESKRQKTGESAKA